MLIHLSWHCADYWQEEVQFDRYGQIMEQTLLVPIMNYRKHWKRWIILKSRITCKEMVLIGLCGVRTHLEHHIWEVWGNTKHQGILEGLLKTLLNDETLRTMTTEVKSIINSRPNSNGQIPFSPSKLLKMKANVVMPHLVSLQNQIYIPEEDGDMCSILQRSFDTDGEWSFCKVYRLDKNGMIKGEILTLVTLWYWKSKTVNVTNGH